MDFSTRYKKLNDRQRQAVDHIDGPLMVIAGPGTGKTELLSMRAANILRSTDTLPDNILCLTFTESGAHAMRERLSQIIGKDAYRVAIHTFHSFGSEVINQNGEFFYHGAHFRPADELSSYELISKIFDELDYDNPLSVKMNGEYTYLSDTLTTISELKKSGLTSDELLQVLDANDAVIDAAEPLLRESFGSRISKTTRSSLEAIVPRLRELDDTSGIVTVTPLSRILADSLQAAIDASESSTKPLTAWKNTWMKKNEAGELILKSRDRSQKLRAVSYIYFQYLSRMQEAELYDFDDMILRVVHAMEVFSELRFNLQEKYQYIMVDEFQDTNMAQMRILFDLTSNEINEGRPNIMVVGDDDQAIYSFQGAEVGNISTFRDSFNPVEIVLTDNYRSAPVVLERARDVITQGADRLESRIPELDKTLTPHRPSEGSSFMLTALPTVNDERHWIVSDIKKQIEAGESPSAIAVLARRHHEIVALLPYFAEAGIRVNYERRDNVLDLEIIRLMEHVSEILIALFEGRHEDADSYLPELLSHPAFGYSATDIWKLSLQARAGRQTWMEVMAVQPVFVPLHTWLLVQAQSIRNVPLEHMCDHIIGHKERVEPIDGVYISPLYSYFFSKERLETHPDDYLTFLEALRCIRQKLREYQPDQVPTLQTFVEFIRLHRQLDSTITSVRSSSDAIDDAVNLMTAHKSKGLEFDRVYVMGAIDSAWGERVRTRSRLIGYPENLPLAPSGDSLDERLRLFFVAMTRAKKHLTISYSTLDAGDKNTLPASFLKPNDAWQTTEPTVHTSLAEVTHAAELAWYQPLVRPIQSSMKELLAPQLQAYKLSATHLNSFLDITRGGPQTFLLNNLLRFPQAISPSAGYGVAVHGTLQRAHAHLAATGKSRPLEDILHDFEALLEAQHLSASDFQTLLQKGTATLTRFLSEKYDSFTPSQKVELNFASQGVTIGSARLTGSLDLVDFSDKSLIITDYKTGHAARSWVGKTDYEKIKLHKYRQQLMFYELLVQHSRSYANYEVTNTIIQFVEPTRDDKIVALEARFTIDELEQFSRLLQKVYHCITELHLPDTSHYPQSYQGMLAFEEDLLTDD